MAEAFDWTTVVDYTRRVPVDPPLTQYELPGITEEMHKDVPVAVVPLWHAVVTGRLAFPADDRATLRTAQARLDRALAEIERVYPLQPGGLFVQVAYGTPYFRERFPTSLTDEFMPKSVMPGSEGEWALVDSIRFPMDPPDLLLEQNDICLHFKSDYRHHIEDVIDALFSPGDHRLNGIPAQGVFIGDLVTVTSTRRGFAGRSMPKLVGEHLGIAGADRIPDGAMLFLGFTSSHVHGLAAGNLASFETLPGFTDQLPGSYFAHGTAMHLSHIALDLERWYAFTPRERLHRMFHPRRTETEEVLSPDQSPATTTFKEERDGDAARYRLVGHNEQMQFLSRVETDTVTAYGEKVERGTAFFLRQDFDTVENPFGFSVDEPVSPEPRAGVHFVGLGPCSQHYELMRREMDSPDLKERHGLPDENLGFTDVLTTTHRQNYLLPPRAHRSFPLAEVLVS
ncbi:DUF7405 family protein [Sporichthya polymorpha]|uniref:DUF7405 family protein n=1 Tax=Sporichthya polymorpha TaxID=35751 RepID=UPI00036B9851|nr:hypothetical protein [Sporichthya polymorpha]